MEKKTCNVLCLCALSAQLYKVDLMELTIEISNESKNVAAKNENQRQNANKNRFFGCKYSF